MTRSVWLILSACPLALACGPTSGPDASGAGQPAIWGPTRVVEDLRIGVAEGDDAYMFGRIRELAAGHDGAIFVADAQVNVVRMFDQDGGFVGNVGQAGQGPGEYSQIAGMKVLPDGRLAIRDAGSQRILFFTAGGDPAGEIRVQGGVWGGNSLEYDMDGNLYVHAATNQSAPESEWRSALRKYGPDGGDALGELPMPAPDPDDSGRWFTLQTTQGFLTGFSVATLSDWSPLGYFVAGRSDRYAITVPADGDPLTLGRDLPPVPLRPEERDDWEAISTSIEAQYRAQGITEPMRDLPAIKPAFQAIRVSEEGRIWVQRHVEAEFRDLPSRSDLPPLRWREPVTFDVFEPTGEFLGTVVIPRDIRVLVWRDKLMWGVHMDEDDVERVVRLRVDTAPDG